MDNNISIDKKKDVIIATFIAIQELGSFREFTEEEKAKVIEGLNHASRGGIMDVYPDEKLEELLSLTAGATHKIAMDVGVLAEDGNRPKKQPSGPSRPIWG